ncbi:MAG: hypothetical protein ISQ19_04975, partial [PS1 clade bacterium]|nr:hypothetical protein [PS1 clade bacterium]
RTGRAGRSGAAFTLATRNDTKYVDAIEQLIERSIEREAFAGGDDGEGGGEDKPRRARGGRSRSGGRSADRSEGRAENNGEAKSSASSGGGKRRGLLGRNRRNGKTNGDTISDNAISDNTASHKAAKPKRNEAASKSEKSEPAKSQAPRKSGKKGDAFEGNMPDFLK